MVMRAAHRRQHANLILTHSSIELHFPLNGFKHAARSHQSLKLLGYMSLLMTYSKPTMLPILISSDTTNAESLPVLRPCPPMDRMQLFADSRCEN